MIHELILTLLSKPSSIFHSKELRRRLHPSENILLDRVLDIATQYQTLSAFVKKNTCPTELKSSAVNGGSTYYDDDGLCDGNLHDLDEVISTYSHPGIYVQAFCLALDKGLNSYRNDAVLLERNALDSIESVPFAKIVNVAEKYFELFHLLNKMINQIEQRKLRGGTLLSYLYKQMIIHGSPSTANVTQMIFRECLLIFMDQLSNWLLLGQLNDTCQEFFIYYNGVDVSTSMMETTDLALGLSKTDVLQPVNRSTDAYLICKDYNIFVEMLPTFIPGSIVDKILYTGKMIMLFRKDPKDVTKMGSAARTTKLSVWGDKEDKYFKKLRDLCVNERFDKIIFEKTISDIHSTVVEFTWKYFVVDTKLIEEIGLMKDFFLLGRGELFHEFLYKTDGIRKRPFLLSEINRNCREAFIMAAHQVLYSDEAALKKFTIHFPFEDYIGTDEDLFRERDGWWHILNLKYNITWPMHLIFKPAVLKDYNRLFNFLMRVRKAQRDLDEVWFFHKQSKTDIFCGTMSTRVWQLRNSLMFMVNNLQYYLQVDVLECEYSKLQEKLQESKDFEEILVAHTAFQVNIMSQSFLWTTESDGDNVRKFLPVMHTLMSLLLLVDRFCKTVDELSVNPTALNKIQGEFDVTITVLLEYMGSMQIHPCGVHLSQLYLRLNYNGWFTKALNAGSRV